MRGSGKLTLRADDALNAAIKAGQHRSFALLRHLFTTASFDSELVYSDIERGDLRIFRLGFRVQSLYTYRRQLYFGNALDVAAESGNKHTVRKLLHIYGTTPFTNPNRAFKAAAIRGHNGVLKLIYKKFKDLDKLDLDEAIANVSELTNMLESHGHTLMLLEKWRSLQN